jgi:hypothetical protein
MKTTLRLLLLAAFLLSACAPTITAAPTPTSAPIDVKPAPSNAPAVIAQSPAEGERLPLEPTIELTFDRDMNQARTESAFSFEGASGDAVTGSVAWPDARTLRFTPDDKLAPASTYVASISTSAASADGKSPAEEIQLLFKTVESLAVGQVFPADGAADVDLDSTITVIFNQPVVPLVIAEEQTALPQPIVIAPDVAGTGEWVSSSVYVFQPEKLLASGTHYEVRVEAELKDSLGNPLADSYSWKFVTRAPGIDALSLVNGESNPKMDIENVLLDQAFIVTFLQPMDKEATEAAVTLKDRETGKAVPIKLTWNKEFTALTITPVGRYRISGFYQLDLTIAALAQDGSPLAKGLSFRFSTLPMPRIVRVTPAPNSRATYFESWLSVQFSSPMNFDTLKNRVAVSPEPEGGLRMYYNEYSRELSVMGLKPSTEYIVRILPGMADIYGNKIASEYSWDFMTGKMYPVANLIVPQTPIYRAAGEQTFFFNYTNIKWAEIQLYALTAQEFMRFQRGLTSASNFNPSAQPLRSWQPDANVPLDEIQRVEFDLKDASGKPLAPGYYFLGLNAEPFDYSGSFMHGVTLIVATDNLTLKTTDSEALAWVTDLETGNPTGGVPVVFYDGDGRELGRATSDRSGLAYLKGVSNPAFARAEDASRMAFTAEFWGSGVALGRLGVYQNYWSSPNQPFVYVYTERPIYRPGQDVFIKGIVRQNDDLHYSLLSQKEVYVTISFEGETVYEETLELNEMGTFASVFPIGDETSLGSYDITVKLVKGADEAYGYHSFRVAEYRKPEFQVLVASNVIDVLAGDKFNFALDAAYYSGGFLAGAAVDWFISASSATFAPVPTYQSYSFSDYDYDKYSGAGSSPATLDTGDSILNETGRLELAQTAELGKFTSGSMVTLSANVTDVSGNLVGGSARVHVHPGLVYAGIRTKSYVGIQGEPQSFELVVLDWDSNPVPDQALSVDIFRREWFSVQEKDEQGTLRWVTTFKDTLVTSLKAATDKDGLASVTFTPAVGGIYKAVAHVKDSKGNSQQSSRFVWVAGKDYIPWRQTNDRSFSLVADKDSYAVGDTAKLLIAQPFEGEHYALVTYERGHIYKQDVIKLEGNSTIYELPITKDMAPVAYVSVVVIKGADATSAPDFKMSAVRLSVDLEQQTLDVSIQASKDLAGPRDKVTYTVTVKDYAGKPAQAEVSLALVDKAVLALAPSNSAPLLDAFYPERSLSVVTAVGIMMSADEFNENYRKSIASGEGMGSGGGGKGEGDLGVMTIRQDFRDTAFYEAQVQTDKNGQATVTVTLPENLTTWQMKARAVTADSLVGEATNEIVSAKPLLVNVQTPRFFIVGDTARVGATVHNNTKGPLTVKVRLEAEGVEIISAGEQTVEVEAGRQEYVTWDVKVKYGVTRVDFTAAASGGGYEDASKPAIGTLDGQGIPVYTFHVTETVGTSGVLRDANSVTEAIQVPSTLDYKSLNVNVEISPSLAASMVGGLTYLEDFEYLCMEQTVSRFLPNVAAARALELAGQPSFELRANLDKQVSAALQRIYAKQLADGGWSWWDDQDSDAQVTAYVLLGLIEARQAGYIIDNNTYNRAVQFLRANLPSLEENDAAWQYNRQAFMTYVLARAEKFPSSTAQFLYDNRAHLSEYGKAYLAQALFLEEAKNSRVKTLMSDLTSAAVLSAAGAHWEEEETDYWNWNTDLRATAIVLDAFVRIEPDSVLTVDGVRWLMAHRNPEGWGSTQETAWTLLALTDWLTVSKEFESNYAFAVGVNGQSLRQGQVTPDNLTTPVIVPITNEQLNQQVNYLVIARGAGTGNMYYTAYLNAELPVESIASLDRGIIVSRQYFTLDDPKTPITQIERGDLARVRVTIVAPSALHYVVVNDPLPAGLEAVDSSLLTDVQVPASYTVTDFARRGWGWWYFTHVELRDEKVVLSADYLPAGTYVFTYLARAGTAGTFNVIPTTAWEFYFPDVYGRGEGSVFVVKP